MFGGYYSNKKKFTYTEVVDVANEIGEKSVPFVRFDYVTDFTDVDAIVKDADGTSSIYNVKREGLVWRTEEGDIHFKSKSRDYKAWLEKKIEKDGE